MSCIGKQIHFTTAPSGKPFEKAAESLTCSERLYFSFALWEQQWLSNYFKLTFKDIIMDSLWEPNRKQVVRTQKPRLEPATLTDSLTTIKAIGFLMKNEDSPQLPCLLHHQPPSCAWLCARGVPLPSPSLQIISIWSIHHVGEGWASPRAGNSLAEESQLCISSISQGCADLLLITFQQLGTISFLTTENDLGGK